jgi:hypothetical protein
VKPPPSAGRTGSIELAPGADGNGLALMLSGLIRQNLEAKPHKWADFAGLHGTAAIVADDADVALTLCFEGGDKLVIHDGVFGLPDVTIRGPSDAIIAMSNLPSTTPLGLPVPNPRDREAVGAVRTLLGALRSGKLHVHGLLFHVPFVLRLGHVMSVNG